MFTHDEGPFDRLNLPLRTAAAVTGSALVVAGVTIGSTGFGTILGVPLAVGGAALFTRSVV